MLVFKFLMFVILSCISWNAFSEPLKLYGFKEMPQDQFCISEDINGRYIQVKEVYKATIGEGKYVPLNCSYILNQEIEVAGLTDACQGLRDEGKRTNLPVSKLYLDSMSEDQFEKIDLENLCD